MKKNDLVTSQIARQNVLNNNYALVEIEHHFNLGGVSFQNEKVFTKSEVAEILDIDERTVDRYIKNFGNELKENGYRVITKKTLQELRLAYVNDTNVVDISTKIPALGIFNFRALLNLAMLVSESDRAKFIRSRILDIVIDVIAKKSGGHTKYINQRDTNFLPAILDNEGYRKKFTEALRDCLNMGNHKYPIYTDKIYKAVFLENAKEYKQILNLSKSDKTRDTMYAEVLKAIASIENGLAEQLQNKCKKLGRKLNPKELDDLIDNASENPFLKPIFDDAREKMATRDLGFRDALHRKLEHYITEVSQEDFNKYLGNESKSLKEQLEDPGILSVLKRLKDR